MASIRHHGDRRFGQPAQQLDMPLFQAGFKFPAGLFDELIDIKRLQIDRDVSGRHLGSFHKIRHQLPETFGFVFQYIDVFQGGRILYGSGFEQADIADDRGQRGFDVMRHVRDEFGFHSFTAGCFLYGDLNR